MKQVLIYAGTTEGRQLAETLAKAGVNCCVCVATEYGEQVMEPAPNVEVRMGRLTVEQMRNLYEEKEWDAVVDATHPFATVVTENILESLSDRKELPYFRLMRDTRTEMEQEKVYCFDSVAACVEALKETKGKILLTTGSKDLAAFCQEDSLRDRLAVRVLPGKESIDLCYENGLTGKQIIALQGPFSEEMNLAILHQYEIDLLVTKESGKAGGLDTKFEAAKKAGIPVYLIRKPEQSISIQEASMNEVLTQLEKRLGISLQTETQFDITLAGIGMGAKECMTVALQEQLSHTDLLFGAARMIEGFHGKMGTYPYYLAKDILPVLAEAAKLGKDRLTVTILFSGDSGFYSGSEKMAAGLGTLPNATVRVLPGISSLSYLASKLQVSWQDATIISAHGTEQEIWSRELLDSCKHNPKTFFITSGVEDVITIGKLLESCEVQGYAFEIALGYQLSYENEKIQHVSSSECQKFTEQGLYVGMVTTKQTVSRKVSPGLPDTAFLRDKVPMTKEEIRHVSVCKLGLREDSVVYDIGSGTGSIAIEMALLSARIKVYAIEVKAEAVELIHRNREKFGVKNVEVIQALAPEGLTDLPAPDSAFIGGSKGNLKEILATLYDKNPRMRVVINAVSLETMQEMMTLEELFPMEAFSMTQLSVTHTKQVGSYHMMQGENPVWICSLQFMEKDEMHVGESENR